MKEFTRVTSTGEVHCGWCPDDQFEAQADDGDFLIHGRYPSKEYYFVDGTPIPKPLQPSTNYNWDATTHVWEPNVNKAKQQKKLAIEAKREELIYANILYDGHIFQADEYSVKNIQKKLNEITAAEALSVPVSPMLWRDFENNNYYWSDLAVYKLWLNGFIVAIANRTTSIIIASFVHKDAVSALSTLAEIETYDITTGWG